MCHRLGPADVQAFFDRWIAHIPTPFDDADRAAGYWWELSMRQVEVSRTLVLDDPRRARGFFEALAGVSGLWRDGVTYSQVSGGVRVLAAYYLTVVWEPPGEAAMVSSSMDLKGCALL